MDTSLTATTAHHIAREAGVATALLIEAALRAIDKVGQRDMEG